MNPHDAPVQDGTSATADEFVPPVAPDNEAPDSSSRPCSPPIPPPPLFSERAARLLHGTLGKASFDLRSNLEKQAHMLDTFFDQLMLENAACESFDESVGLDYALRSQSLYRSTVALHEELRVRERKEDEKSRKNFRRTDY